MAGVWSLDGADVQADLERFRSGEMRVALLARRDEVDALRKELEAAARQRDGAVRAAATADRAIEEVRRLRAAVPGGGRAGSGHPGGATRRNAAPRRRMRGRSAGHARAPRAGRPEETRF